MIKETSLYWYSLVFHRSRCGPKIRNRFRPLFLKSSHEVICKWVYSIDFYFFIFCSPVQDARIYQELCSPLLAWNWRTKCCREGMPTSGQQPRCLKEEPALWEYRVHCGRERNLQISSRPCQVPWITWSH